MSSPPGALQVGGDHARALAGAELAIEVVFESTAAP